MDCTCLRQTELPGTTSLFADLVYRADRTARFFVAPDDDFEFPDDRRAALVRALREQNTPSALLDRLAEPGTVAVVTGQQVGLYSGPAYTIYKALTAIKLAKELTDSGTQAVPIFWLATEDHDFAEVNQAWVFDSQYTPTKLQTAAIPHSNQPVGGVPAGTLAFDALRQGLAGLPFADEVASLAEAAYAPGATFGQAFGTLVRSLLGNHQILFVDPMAPAIRKLAAPALSLAVGAAGDLSAALLERNRELSAAGYHAQVHVEAQTALFFLLDQGKRVALRRENGKYSAQGHTYSTEDLQARAEALSPNALLRPVIQDYMIPTHTYVGGPAELSYLAQSNVLYQRLLGRQSRAVHRAGFTILDFHSHKLMQRYGLTLPDFYTGEEALRERAARKLVPPALTARMAEVRTNTGNALARLKGDLLEFDPTLVKALNRSARKVEFQLSKIESKVARQTIVRDERASRDARMLSNLVFPHRHLQERFYSILPLVAKHGLTLVDDIYGQLELNCPDHQIVTM